MEETIQAGCSAAGRIHPNRAAGFCALLGMALFLNQGIPGREPGGQYGQEITQVESGDIANQIKAGGVSGRYTAFENTEKLLLRMLPAQDDLQKELCLTEKILPEPSLILPELSDGNVWQAAEQERPDVTQGELFGDRAFDDGIPVDSPAAGNFMAEGAAADPFHPETPSEGAGIKKTIVPGIPSDAGSTVEPILPELSLDAGSIAEPIAPEAPSGDGSKADPTVPEFPSGAGNTVNPIVPDVPSDAGNTADLTVSDVPSGVGNTADLTVPETPADDGITVNPIVPETPADDGTTVNPIVPGAPADNGTTANPIVPGAPADNGTTVSPVVPEAPSDVGGTAEPIVPENPAGGEAEEPAVPDQDASQSAADKDSVPDTGTGGGQEQEAPSCFLLDEMGMLCGFLPEYAEIPDGCLTLPAECTGIRSGAFSGSGDGIVELYIPSGAAVIEEGALAGLVSLEWIDVESGNPGCAGDCGVLFDSTMTVLLAFPAAWMDVYAVPSCVTRIADRAFEGTSIYRLDIRDCAGLSFGEQVFGDTGGDGIQVAVPEHELEMYTEMLSGYAVTVTK